MNRLQANLSLICVTLCWSTEVIIFACIPDSVPPFATTCITNLIAAVILFLCFFKRIKSEVSRAGKKLILRCMLLGALNCAYNIFYIYGLDYFDVSTGAFTFSMTVVILPVILLTRKRSVAKKTWLSAGLVLVGIVLALGSNLVTAQFMGLLLMLIGCILRAIFIILLNNYAKENESITISSFICTFVAVFSFVIWFIMEPRTFAAFEWSKTIIASLFIYSYFIVAFAQTINIFAQKRATATSATIIYSLEIVFSLIWGSILPANLVDPVTPSVFHIIGAVFVVAGSMIEIVDFKGKRRLPNGAS